MPACCLPPRRADSANPLRPSRRTRDATSQWAATIPRDGSAVSRKLRWLESKVWIWLPYAPTADCARNVLKRVRSHCSRAFRSRN